MDENEKKEKSSSLFKTAKFYVTIVCCVLFVVQIVCRLFCVNFETELIVESVSFVLAILISFGILTFGGSKDKSIFEIRSEIEEEIEEQSEGFKSDKDEPQD